MYLLQRPPNKPPTNPTQEEIELKPGYALDPLQPLWLSTTRSSASLPQKLYQMAIDVDTAGNEFDWLEAIDDHISNIQDGLFSWYQIALKAWKIKLFKAWKREFSSFREFCEQALGVTASSINAKIRAARVVSQLISLGFDRLPQSPSVAHELSKLDWESLEDTWRDICDRFSDHEITLEKVKNMLADPFGKMPELKQIRIPIDQWERLQELARQGNTNPTRLLEGILDQYLGDTHDDRLPTGAEDPETSAIAGLANELTEGVILSQDHLPHETEPAINDCDPDEETPTESQNIPQHPEQTSDQILISPEPRSPDPPPMFAIGQILPNFWRSQ